MADKKVLVTLKSPWASKINWLAALQLLFTVGTVFGVDVPPDIQVKVLGAFTAGSAVVTWILRTWFTPGLETSVVGG